MENNELITQFHEKIISIVDEFHDLPPYELGFALIRKGVYIMLCTAPNELLAIQTALQSVLSTIQEYKEIRGKNENQSNLS